VHHLIDLVGDLQRFSRGVRQSARVGVGLARFDE